jgi:hypothetical protein
MEKLRFLIFFPALILAASSLSSCGTSSSHLSCLVTSQNPGVGQGQLQSIALSPATADAQNCANGQVQFVATGQYIDPTQTITPLSANWAVCQQNEPTAEASVTNKGVAQCASGASGTYSINAFDPGNCNAINACGTSCTIHATVQLTCP